MYDMDPRDKWDTTPLREAIFKIVLFLAVALLFSLPFIAMILAGG